MTVFKVANEINDMHPYAADKICLTMIMKYIAWWLYDKGTHLYLIMQYDIIRQ